MGVGTGVDCLWEGLGLNGWQENREVWERGREAVESSALSANSGSLLRGGAQREVRGMVNVNLLRTEGPLPPPS